MLPKVTSSVVARILEMSQQNVEKLARDGVLPCDLVQSGENKHVKVFDREVIENIKRQREIAKAQSKKAA